MVVCGHSNGTTSLYRSFVNHGGGRRRQQEVCRIFFCGRHVLTVNLSLKRKEKTNPNCMCVCFRSSFKQCAILFLFFCVSQKFEIIFFSFYFFFVEITGIMAFGHFPAQFSRPHRSRLLR